MPEGVGAYPRWRGPLTSRPAFPVIAEEEIRRARINPWSQAALILTFGYGVVFLASVQTLVQRSPESHSMDNFLYLLNLLRWGALGLAAIMAGPALLEDRRQGALELYLSRAVTRADYLAGKVLAVFGLTTLAVLGPGLIYYVGALFLFQQQPAQWGNVPAGLLVYSLMWGAMVSGLGLGLSCVAKSSRAATIVLFAGFAIADVLISSLLEAITRDGTAQILSPFAALAAQNSWIFGTQAPTPFPAWWGLLVWGLLTGIGWALVAWKHPRLAGA